MKFKFEVDGELETVRGLFVAMAGFDDNTFHHMFNVAQGCRNNLILRISLNFWEGRVTLDAAIMAKVDAAEQEGRWWLPLGR